MKKSLLFYTLLIFVCGSPAFAQDYHWPLTSDLTDIVGGKNGTNHGVTFVNDAVRGPVAYFEGSTAYANLPSFLNGLTEVTIAVWFRMDEVRPWSRIYSFGKGDQSEPKDVMMVIPVNGAADPVKNWFRFTLSDPAGPWADIDIDPAVATINPGEWFYSVVALKADSIILFINDQEVFAESGFSRSIGTLDDRENALGKSFWPDQLWKGALSDLRVYKKALTDAEIVALYNSTKGPSGIDGSILPSEVPVVYADYMNRINVKLNQPVTDETVSVYSLTGALIDKRPVQNSTDISLKSGLYIVKVQGRAVNYATKIFLR
ncbi:MAG: LamG-like jellyroll fold domain-containing protein [Bacteroidales bacterium]